MTFICPFHGIATGDGAMRDEDHPFHVDQQFALYHSTSDVFAIRSSIPSGISSASRIAHVNEQTWICSWTKALYDDEPLALKSTDAPLPPKETRAF